MDARPVLEDGHQGPCEKDRGRPAPLPGYPSRTIRPKLRPPIEVRQQSQALPGTVRQSPSQGSRRESPGQHLLGPPVHDGQHEGWLPTFLVLSLGTGPPFVLPAIATGCGSGVARRHGLVGSAAYPVYVPLASPGEARPPDAAVLKPTTLWPGGQAGDRPLHTRPISAGSMTWSPLHDRQLSPRALQRPGSARGPHADPLGGLAPVGRHGRRGQRAVAPRYSSRSQIWPTRSWPKL